jgi:hypothetical protein
MNASAVFLDVMNASAVFLDVMNASAVFQPVSWEAFMTTDQLTLTKSLMNAHKSEFCVQLQEALASPTTMEGLAFLTTVLTDQIKPINGTTKNGTRKLRKNSNAPNNLPDLPPATTSKTSTLRDVSDAHIVDELLRRLHSGVLMPRDSQTQTVTEMKAMKHLQVRLHALYRAIGRELSE